MILALDISLSTGYAYGEPGNLKYGTRLFHDQRKDYAVLGRVFRGWVAKLMDEVEPSMLAIERPFYRHGKPSQVLWGLAWEAHRAAEIRRIPRVEYAPISIKKYITGSGRAEKSDVIRAVKALGYAPKDDNASDAIALLLLAHSEI